MGDNIYQVLYIICTKLIKALKQYGFTFLYIKHLKYIKLLYISGALYREM